MLSKIEELRYIAKSTNAAVIGICEFKLDASLLDPEIIDNYKILLPNSKPITVETNYRPQVKVIFWEYLMTMSIKSI